MEQLDGNVPVPEIVVDACLDAGGATKKLVKELAALEPFGQGNSEPVLVISGAMLRHATVMGTGGNHLRGIFEAFKQNGLFDKATADAFHTNVLERGNTEDPMVLYKRFRGQDPSITPLLRNRGLL